MTDKQTKTRKSTRKLGVCTNADVHDIHWTVSKFRSFSNFTHCGLLLEVVKLLKLVVLALLILEELSAVVDVFLKP